MTTDPSSGATTIRARMRRFALLVTILALAFPAGASADDLASLGAAWSGPDDFRALATSFSDKPLDAVFDAWLFGTSLPRLP